MTDILNHLRILGALPVSSEGEGSPIIWPISKTNDTTPTKVIWIITDILKERLSLHLRILGAPPVSSEGNGSPIKNK